MIKASVLYFALVFGAGFMLGVLRTLFVEPRLGKRRAELLEMPFMLVITVLSAGWTMGRLTIPSSASARLLTGGVALLFMLAAEFGLMLCLRRLSVRQYLTSRDPVSGTAYYLMLLVFAVMPFLIGLASTRF